MTFFIPPIFLFGNNTNRLHNEKEKSEYKTAAETEIKVENWRVKRIAELEEENEKLRAENEYLHKLLPEADGYIIEKQMEKRLWNDGEEDVYD